MSWRKKPSDLLFIHVEGTGTGYEMDDLISGGSTPQEIVDEVIEINERFRSAEHPIGVENPDAFAEIRALAVRVRERGL
jgi:hypothetical protein